MREDYVAVLDLGTTKTVVMVGCYDSNRNLEILAYDKIEHLSGALTFDKVNQTMNTDIIASSIKEAIANIKRKCGIEIKRLNLGITAISVVTEAVSNKTTIIASSSGFPKIEQDHLNKLKLEIEQGQRDANREVLHILPSGFILDGKPFNLKGGVIGRTCSMLEVNYNIITINKSFLAMIKSVVSSCGVEIESTVLEPLGSSLSVLTSSEKELGVLMIDIGGGTTDCCFFKNGYLIGTKIIPMGGEIITGDLQEEFSLLSEEAEILKREYGSALEPTIYNDNIIKIGRGRELVEGDLVVPIAARVAKILSYVGYEIECMGGKLEAGVVLTGGGAMLKNIKEAVEEYLGLQTRIASPFNLVSVYDKELMQPMFATAIGLIRYVLDSPLRARGLNSQTKNSTLEKDSLEESVTEGKEIKTVKPKRGFADRISSLVDKLAGDNKENILK